MHGLLQGKAEIVLWSGLDRYRTKKKKKGHDTEGNVFSALISINENTIAKRSEPGVIVAVDEEKKSSVYQCDAVDVDFSPKDTTYGGLLPKSRHYAGFNPLLMVKPPQATAPLNISRMTAWLGDIAPTVRDYLGIPPAGQGRSLIKPEDPARRLHSPLFLRGDQDPFWGKLADWKRVEFHGVFGE